MRITGEIIAFNRKIQQYNSISHRRNVKLEHGYGISRSIRQLADLQNI